MAAAGKPRADGARRAHGLTREGIVDTCLRLADAEGSTALTFRRIGRELGADPTALYRHFKDKDELLLALADRLIGEALRDFAPSPSWRATLRDLMVRGRRAYLAHPQVAVLAAVRITRQESELRFVETLLATLRDAGFPREEAARAYRACADFMLAWTAFSAQLKSLGDQSAQDDRAWVESYAKVPAAEYPHAVAAVRTVVGISDNENFAFALDLLLDGLAARLP
ncbi:TetR/AcrR family transcriptional regulator C-terminal domain-containing protein [Arthrobacter mobilis]|uniref:TetR family transcriptional regulator n=1 Tax=Arthrobacter mobilis TaxID=2724944 RepID=A0A7X6HDK0_9MICC|nr:TetR/AcrR family transcriptional regulator C-terminal domain-containing protein [Arthrobacter mobilis]NKX55153.1 TetR family transcriptional regulator [Arthrobacter mobilis]